MRRLRFGLAILLLVCVLSLALTAQVCVAEDTAIVSYTTGDGLGHYANIYSNYWGAQTFNLHRFSFNGTYVLSKLRLQLYKVGNPGNLTIGVRLVINGVIGSSDLVSATINGNALTTNGAGQWYDIYFSPTTIYLGLDWEYAIVLRAPSGGVVNKVCWMQDTLTGEYAWGAAETSADNGISWTNYYGGDFHFREYSTNMTLYENYGSGCTWQEMSDLCSYGSEYPNDPYYMWAEVFIPQVSHTVGYVSIYGYATGGFTKTVYIAIMRVDEDTGLPVGNDMCSGSTTFNPYPGLGWYTAGMAGIDRYLIAGMPYAIVIWSIGNCYISSNARFCYDMYGSYSKGYTVRDLPNDPNWTHMPDAKDFMFEVWGSTFDWHDYNQVVWFQPNTIIEGTTLPNRAQGGTLTDGKFTWGSNPIGVSAVLSGFYSDYAPANITLPQDIIAPSQDIVGPTGNPGITSDVGTLTGNVFYPLVKALSDNTNIPVQLWWIILASGIVLIAMVVTYRYLPHQMMTALVGGGLSTFFYALGIYPFWVIFIFVVMALAIIIGERSPTV